MKNKTQLDSQINGTITSKQGVPQSIDAEILGSALQEIADYAAGGYKCYSALLTQSSTSAPVATVLGANSIGDIVWTRTGVGTYVGTLAGAFTTSTLIPAVAVHSATAAATLKRTGNDTVQLLTYEAGSLADGVLAAAAIEIRVYI